MHALCSTEGDIKMGLINFIIKIAELKLPASLFFCKILPDLLQSYLLKWIKNELEPKFLPVDVHIVIKSEPWLTLYLVRKKD